MDIINLPDILIGTRVPEYHDVMFYYHISGDADYRTKITFNSHCITLLLTGKKHILVEDKSLFYDNTSCLLFKAGNYLSTKILPNDEPYHSILIFFNNTALDQIRYKYQDVIDAQKATIPIADKISISTDSYLDHFKNSIKQIFDDTNVPFSPRLQRLKFEEIMLYLLERYGASVIDFFKNSIGYGNETVFKRIIENNVFNLGTIEEMAFLCNMSVSTFKRVFFDVYGRSPGKWIREKRLEKSAYLIGVHKKTASEIYEEMGFSSLSSFSQSFKKQFGITPKQYKI
ncbi:helix-turn-helix domain-containing protein [Aquimarina litoralis]|uniref:helix-turn-helix domain-containing protein n=1 Tax=Aquimarina litoralis TaxID=584605 RepID=UPI001C55C579|nr:AraC family transcriptional regulator [Aquimarina litoralis]MBW1298589.1 helix-turn-helix domain-containing protein [Aquimarina litoralis]